MTTTTPAYNIPIPVGATKVYKWESDGARYFVGRKWVISGAGSKWHPQDLEVGIDGTQYCDGNVERRLTAGYLHPDQSITSEQAREFGRALIAAADEYDALAT